VKRQSLPASFDWRDYTDCRSLVDIRSQYCGNCWASAAASTMSDRHCLINGIDRIFSEAQTTRCASTNGGCEGGASNKAFDLYANTGVSTGGDEAVVPSQPLGCVPKSYLSSNSNCPSKCTNGSSLNNLAGTGSDTLLDVTQTGQTMTQRIAAVKQEVYDYGPVVVYLQAYADFENHTTGVYVHNPSVQCGGSDPIWCGHAIRIIGWGSELYNGVMTPYWLCANQWGTWWGDNGMIKIKQGITDKSGVDWFTAWAYPA